MISSILAILVFLSAPVTWVVCRKRRIPILIAFIYSCILGSICYIGVSYFSGLELEREMYRFDLNGDREFSEDELTDEAKAALKRWSTDTGRTLAPIVAPIATFIWTSLVFSSLCGADRVLTSIRKKNEKRA